MPTVLQVLPALETGGGGVERSTIDIAEALAASGARALVASSGGHQVRELERKGGTHYTLPLASKNPFVMRKNVERLAELIEAQNVDIVHARSRAPAWSARAAARRTGRTFMTTFHGTYNYGGGFAGFWKKYYNAVMASGDVVIANSRFIDDHVRHNYGTPAGKLRIIARGVDVDIFDADKVSAARVISLSERWRLPDGASVVMLPGRLTRWKGQLLLVEAMSRLQERRGGGDIGVVAILVGSDQGRSAYRARIEKLVRERGLLGKVQMLGHCDDMSAAYKLADVVVSASTDPEAFGRVVAEAQAMGRPVVVADHGGAAEQVVPGETGWLFTPGDPDALADALEKALSLDEAAREALARRAGSHAREHYSKAGMCTATLKIYAELGRVRRPASG